MGGPKKQYVGLHNQFAGFELPAEVKQMYKAGYQPFGSQNMAKMMFFANDVKLNNDVIDYYMGIAPSRREGESIEEYKNRGKFQKVLYKYRAHIYDYSVYTKQN